MSTGFLFQLARAEQCLREISYGGIDEFSRKHSAEEMKDIYSDLTGLSYSMRPTLHHDLVNAIINASLEVKRKARTMILVAAE